MQKSKNCKHGVCKKELVLKLIFAGEVLTDQKWLAFILRQLLSNAVKYSNQIKKFKSFLEKTKQVIPF